MRPAVLSFSPERVLGSIRNTILAHAGYGVIPATSMEGALKALRSRHVCAIVVDNAVPAGDRRALCREANRLGVPVVVLDSYDEQPEEKSELHVNPLDDPEIFLDALSTLVMRDHRRGSGFCGV